MNMYFSFLFIRDEVYIYEESEKEMNWKRKKKEEAGDFMSAGLCKVGMIP
jgi:hypothetical protein